MDRKKRLYGLIGFPVKHSLSPLMHNAAFKFLLEQKQIDYDAEYRLFEIKPTELENFFEKIFQNSSIKDINGDSVSTQDIFGFNITIPHKVKAREILEKRFPFDKNAKEINKYLFYVQISGAINTVKKDNNKLKYWNTDAEGFLESLGEDLEFVTKNKNILLIGCGGAGRAIVASLSWIDVGINKIYINEISADALNSAKEHFYQASERLKNFSINKLQFVSNREIPAIIKECDLLVNATPIGMKEDDPPLIERKLLHNNLSVYDVVYNRETQLIKDAKMCNLNYIDGSKMLWRQGILSFGIWMAKKAPEEVMWKALCSQITCQ